MSAHHVLFVAACPFPSHQGSQVYIRGMAEAVASSGATVALAAYDAGGSWPRGVAKVGAGRPQWVRGMGSGPKKRKVLLDAQLVAAVARYLRQHPVDVIHAHHVEGVWVAQAALKAVGRRVPLVYNLHTSLEEELPVYGSSDRWRQTTAAWGARVDRQLAGSCDAAVAISPRAAKLLRSWGAARVCYVPPCLEEGALDGADPSALLAAEGPGPYVLYTGNLDAYQDVPDLLQAMLQIPEARLLVVTGEPEDRVRQLCDAQGLPASRVVVVSTRSFAETKDAMAAATVAVVPRAVCAGFPIKVLNTLGLGVPTVMVREVAPPVEGVLTVPAHNAGAIAGLVRSLLYDPAYAADLGEAARRAARTRFSWNLSLRELQALYDELRG